MRTEESFPFVRLLQRWNRFHSYFSLLTVRFSTTLELALFAASTDLFIIFNPTNRINVNNHLFLPINSPPWGGGGDFLAICSLVHLACSPSLSKVTTWSFGHSLPFLFGFSSFDPQQVYSIIRAHPGSDWGTTENFYVLSEWHMVAASAGGESCWMQVIKKQEWMLRLPFWFVDGLMVGLFCVCFFWESSVWSELNLLAFPSLKNASMFQFQ